MFLVVRTLTLLTCVCHLSPLPHTLNSSYMHIQFHSVAASFHITPSPPSLLFPCRTILLSVISLLNEPNTFSAANVDASVKYRRWRESRGKDKEYEVVIRLVWTVHTYVRTCVHVGWVVHSCVHVHTRMYVHMYVM